MKEIEKIDLGHDGAHALTLEYQVPFGLSGYGRWHFCRDGQSMRMIDHDYLEGKLVQKIVELMQK